MAWYSTISLWSVRIVPIPYFVSHATSQRISYAKTKSYATLRCEDPNFIPPNLSHASSAKRLREAEESNVRAKRERVDEEDEEMDIDDDDDEADPAAPTTSNSTSVLSYVYCPGIINYSTVFTLSSSTVYVAQVQPSNKLHCSNLPQEVTNGVLAVLFQQYVWWLTPLHNLYLTNPSDTVVFRQRKSSHLQNPTEPETRSKQQKLSLRMHSLPQLQDRCLMASSSRKGGTWLSRFYHRQVDFVVVIVNLQGQSHSLITSNTSSGF